MHGRFTALFLTIALLDWLALFWLINRVWPSPVSLQIFFFLLFMGIFTTSVPLYYHLGLRFRGFQRRKGIWPPVRRGFLTALYGLSCALMAVMRAISGVIVVLMLGILALLELFFSVFVD